MKIRRLYLKNFGKFHDQEFILEDGINVFFGRNEAGKSTIHRFIFGMLYGFKKPDRKRRYYEDDFDKYRPWAGASYEGLMEYEGPDSRLYRLERRFDQDETKIYDAVTGTSLESSFSMDGRREYLFAEEHLGFNSIVFENTVSITQRRKRTAQELAAEVASRLANLEESGTEEVSVKKSLKALKKKEDDIGTARSKKLPLGQTMARLEEVEAERDECEKIHQMILSYEEQRARIEKALSQAKDQLKTTQEKKKDYRRALDWEKWKKILSWEEQKEEEEKKKEALLDFAHFPAEKKEDVIRLETNLHALQDQLETKKEEIAKVEEEHRCYKEELDSYPASVLTKKMKPEELSADFSSWTTTKRYWEEEKKQTESIEEKFGRIKEEMEQMALDEQALQQISRAEEEAADLESLRHSKLLSAVKDEQNKEAQASENTKRAFGLGLMLTLTALFVSFFLIQWGESIFIYPIIGLALIGDMAASRSYGKWNRLYELHKKEKDELKASLKEERKMADRLNENRETALKAAQAENLHEAVRKKNQYEAVVKEKRQTAHQLSEQQKQEEKMKEQVYEMEETLKRSLKDLFPKEEEIFLSPPVIKKALEIIDQAERLKEKIEGLERAVQSDQEELGRLKQKKEKQKNDLDSLMAEAKVQTVEAFTAGCEKKEQYERASAKIQYYEDILDRYYQEKEKDDWQKEAEAVPEYVKEMRVEEKDLERVEKREEQLKKGLEELGKRQSSLQASADTLNERHRSLFEVEEERQFLSEQKEKLKRQVEAIRTAREMIETLSDEIKREFAPSLNKKISHMVVKITDGRYDKVRVNEDLDLFVESPETQRQVNILSLSEGTIDQFYFAARAAMGELVAENKNPPLFLDDPFTQYDDIRTKRVLSLMKELALDRQILLFTCRQREGQLLEEMGISHQLIEL